MIDGSFKTLLLPLTGCLAESCAVYRSAKLQAPCSSLQEGRERGRDATRKCMIAVSDTRLTTAIITAEKNVANIARAILG